VFDERLVRTFETREVTSQRGVTLPICRLDKLFGHAGIRMPMDTGPLSSLRSHLMPEPKPLRNDGRRFVVITQVGDRRLGLVVDRLFGQQDIVIKALGKSLGDVRGFAGATELGDQRVALVLDVAALVDEVLTGTSKQHMQLPERRLT